MISYIFFAILMLAAAACAWQIAVTDWRRRIIPDAYLFPLLLIGMLVVSFFPWVCSVSAAAVGAAFGYAMAAVIGFAFDWRMRRRNPASDIPIGMGDIKLISVGGLWLGTTGLAAALVIACISGAIWARRRNQKYVPFAPFFVGGGILSLIGMLFLL